jgi:hypothetical protein
MPVPQDPGRDDSPSRVPSWPGWMDDPAYLAARAGDHDPGDPGLAQDPDEPPPGVDDEELAALIAEARQITGRVSLTIPAATLLDRAGRPGELAGIGPIDPDLEANTSDRCQNEHQPTAATSDHVGVTGGQCQCGG